MDNYLSTQNNDIDDIFSVGNNDEETENKENIHKLVNLECENSLNISSDINNVSEIRNSKHEKGIKNKNYCKRIETPIFHYKHDRNYKKSDEILKYIADNSDYEEKPMSVIKKLNVSNYYLQNDDNQINFTRLQHIDINSNEIYKKHIDLEEKLVSSKDYEKILISILNSNLESNNVLESSEKKMNLLNLIKLYLESKKNEIFSIHHCNFEVLSSPYPPVLIKENFSFNIDCIWSKKNVSCGLIRADSSIIRSSKVKEAFSPIITEENEFKYTNRFNNDDLFSVSNIDFVFLASKKQYLSIQQNGFTILERKSNYSNASTQSKLLGDDIQRLYALNEEYNEQLCAYKEENSKIKRVFTEKLKKYKQKSINFYENLQPEMISPQKSFKILIYALKHFKYEETELKKYVEKKDISCLKDFIRRYQSIDRNTVRSVEKKTLGNLNNKYDKEININCFSSQSIIYSKYKNMLQNILNNNFKSGK